MKNFFEILKNVELFRGIAEKDLSDVLSCLKATAISYDKGKAVLLEGSPADSIGILLSGKVHIVKEDYHGNRNIVAEVLPSELFGEVFVCAEMQSLPVSVFAAEQSKILFISRSRILNPCDKGCGFHNLLIANLLKIISQKALFLNRKINVLSKRTTREKLLSYLGNVCYSGGKKAGEEFVISFNRQELADFLCVDRSAMSAELSKMQRDGLIVYSGKRFKLL